MHHLQKGRGQTGYQRHQHELGLRRVLARQGVVDFGRRQGMLRNYRSAAKMPRQVDLMMALALYVTNDEVQYN